MSIEHKKDPSLKVTDHLNRVAGAVAAIALFLANIGAISTHVDNLRLWLLPTLGLAGLQSVHYYLVALIASAAIVGFGALFYWVHRKYIIGSGDTVTIAYILGAAFFTATGAYVIGAIFPKPFAPSALLQQQMGDFKSTLYGQQLKSGGFKWATKGGSHDTQGWTTAQALYGLLSSGIATSGEVTNVRQAFDYLEQVRIKSPTDGWGYLDGASWGVTEINSWVTLAYLASLKSPNSMLIWSPERIPEIIARIERDLAVIARRQLTNGGWSPTRLVSNVNHSRTYSTIMAVWALTEAQLSASLPSTQRRDYDDNIKNGAQWLLITYRLKPNGIGGWWPNPNSVASQDEFVGLTAQTLYVLSRASVNFDFIRAAPRFREAKANLLTLTTRGVGAAGPQSKFGMKDNPRLHDSDGYLEGLPEFYLERSTFLWYPWTLLFAVETMNDKASPDIVGPATTLVSALVQRSNEFVKFVDADGALYPTAEGLFAIGLYLRSQPMQKP